MKVTKIRLDREDMPVKAGFGLLLFTVAGFTAVNSACLKLIYGRRQNYSYSNVRLWPSSVTIGRGVTYNQE